MRPRLSLALTLGLSVALLLGLSACTAKSPDSVPGSTEAKTPSAAPQWSDDPDYEFVSLSVEGMSCAAGCAPEVTKTLESLPTVSACQVDFDTKLAKCQVKKGTSTDTLVHAFDGSRFQVSVAKE